MFMLFLIMITIKQFKQEKANSNEYKPIVFKQLDVLNDVLNVNPFTLYKASFYFVDDESHVESDDDYGYDRFINNPIKYLKNS